MKSRDGRESSILSVSSRKTKIMYIVIDRNTGHYLCAKDCRQWDYANKRLIILTEELNKAKVFRTEQGAKISINTHDHRRDSYDFEIVELIVRRP